MSSSLFRARDPVKVKGLYQDMYSEVKERIRDGVAGINRKEKFRVGFFGLAPWHALSLFDRLAETGLELRQGRLPSTTPDARRQRDQGSAGANGEVQASQFEKDDRRRVSSRRGPHGY